MTWPRFTIRSREDYHRTRTSIRSIASQHDSCQAVFWACMWYRSRLLVIVIVACKTSHTERTFDYTCDAGRWKWCWFKPQHKSFNYYMVFVPRRSARVQWRWHCTQAHFKTIAGTRVWFIRHEHDFSVVLYKIRYPATYNKEKRGEKKEVQLYNPSEKN